jgi:hypothetical protein
VAVQVASHALTSRALVTRQVSLLSRVACDFLADPTLASRPTALLQAFVAAAAVFNNCTQDVQARSPPPLSHLPLAPARAPTLMLTRLLCQCYSLPADDPFFDGLQWDYQWCTQLLPEELFFPMRGDTDMFFPRDFSSHAFLQQYCALKYSASPRPDWIPATYGGVAYPGTNVVFSNGLLDPWSSAGVLNSTHPSVIIAVIPDGAHHLDLFFSNPMDPPSVIAARAVQIAAMREWVQQ